MASSLIVEDLPLNALRPYERNARTHSPAQVEQVAASVRAFGWTNPLLIDEDGLIIAGHGRLAAAKVLGLAAVPCIRLRGLSDTQKRALAIADNKLALNAGWDEGLLAAELQSLGDLQGLVGFSDDELVRLFKGHAGLTDPDAVPPEPATPVTERGDLWLLGGHRLLCGDATDAEIVAVLLDGTKPSLAATDPPYGIGYGYAEHEDSDNAANADLVANAFAFAPTAKVWTPGLNNLARDIGRFGRAKVLVWSKGFAAAGNGLGGASTWEPVLVVGDLPSRQLKNNVLEFPTDREEIDGVSLRELHSCPKPVALYQTLIEAFAGATVYEPFAGSGTTIIAGEMTGRRVYALEITPAYVDVAIIRWQNFTGKQATDEAGVPFDEVAAQRQAKAA